VVRRSREYDRRYEAMRQAIRQWKRDDYAGLILAAWLNGKVEWP
jgi:hypothetical protein